MDKPYTDEQWYKMVDSGICEPVPFHTAELESEWVYYRPWGLMYVGSGWHQCAMANLYAFTQGHADFISAARAMDIKGYRAMETLADMFLDMDGTAFKSSVGNHVTVGKTSNLNAIERRIINGANLAIISLD